MTAAARSNVYTIRPLHDLVRHAARGVPEGELHALGFEEHPHHHLAELVLFPVQHPLPPQRVRYEIKGSLSRWNHAGPSPSTAVAASACRSSVRTLASVLHSSSHRARSLGVNCERANSSDETMERSRRVGQPGRDVEGGCLGNSNPWMLIISMAALHPLAT